MKTISFVNNKGGVAKTSSTANIGAYLAYSDYKVLLIDTDPQANLTQHFGQYDITISLNDAYSQVVAKKENTKLPILQLNDNLFLSPSSGELREMEKALVTKNAREKVLKKLLKPIESNFDFCLIDCPPSLGLLTDNAIAASDYILLPIAANVFSLNGIKSIIKHFQDLKFDLELDFDILGAFMTNYDSQLTISKATRENVENAFKNKFFSTMIRKNTAIEKAQAEGVDIFAYDRTSHAALDYGELSNEILKSIQNGQQR